MPDASVTREGQVGRVVYVGVAPNEDLVGAVEAVCRERGILHAFVRGGLGSLAQAALQGPSGEVRTLEGVAVEVLGLSGEVRADAGSAPCALLDAIAVDPQGQVLGGRLVAGRNPVFATFEVTLEEWLPRAG
jgi:predicted DNA-binding protein with PD1-like motif